VPVEAPQRAPEQEELDALIEEARRRARRRRLGYAASVIAAMVAAGCLYLAFGGGGSDSGTTPQGHAESGGGAAPSAARSASASRQALYRHRCPGRGLQALPLTQRANAAARSVIARGVGSSPEIDVAIRPGTSSGIAHLCGPRVARRTLYVWTYDHRFDHGPMKSASLAQHRIYVARFGDGYHAWYWEH
jgi:hypothetical protein